MPDATDPPQVGGARLREWALASYPAAVVRRFFDLELLDRSFGLAAQAFVALLPLLIVAVSVVLNSDGDVLATQITNRFGLSGAADVAVHALFRSEAAVRTISWLAVAMSVLSAFSLARRLSRTYARIFDLPSLRRSQLWRGVVWIAVQITLFSLASELRAIRRESGLVLAALAVVAILLLWFAADIAGLRLLVPTIPGSLLVPSAVLSGVGRAGLTAWATLYMPRLLTEHAEQFGPIGVTFALFTLILAGVLVLLIAPLLVAVWAQRREAPESAGQ
ncbi:MAG: hypothetical protein ACYC2Z_06530 [Candidatus Nanopelagicales bacterium]